MQKTTNSLLACFFVSLLVTACGGGGGGSNDSASDDTPETFTLSGTIVTSASQIVDSDTNDENTLPVSNDTLGLAQLIPNPVTLGGYINQPGTGATGPSQLSGDLDDFFRVDLLAGQRITMVVADFEQADADLYLYDSQGTQVAHSINTGKIESVLAPRDGTYFILATAWEGATNYNLAIGAPNTLSNASPGEPEIVPWQAVVTYRDESQQAANSFPEKDISLSLGMEQRAGGRGRGRLMALQHRLNNAQHADQRLANAVQRFGVINDPDLRARWETLMTIKLLRKDPRVRHAEPNYRVSALAAPNDESYPLQWHYPLISLPEAWETTTGDPGVVIAVVDTGILSNHPDLLGQLVDGYDFVSDPKSALDGDGIDPDPQDPGSSFGGGSESFHGTHVSGTVVARGNNQVGVAGTAYTSRVMPLRALGAGGEGTTYDVEQAVRFAAGLSNNSGTVPQKRADIINLSLGGAPFDPLTQNLYNEVRAAGVMVVAAAGNQTSSSPDYPASYAGVISVSAVDAQRRLTTYSNTGPSIDVTAPGGDNSMDLNGDGYPDGIFSTSGTISNSGVNYAYAFLNGTSFAAPHVAGVLALMKSVNPDLTPADIDTLLVTGALSDDIGAPGRDDLYGYGIINAQRAVFAALDAAGTPPADNPRLVASASTLNFSGNSTALSLILQNGGKGDLALLSLSVSQPWLGIAAVNVDAAGLGEYEVTVDRSTLTPGVYSGEITAQSSVNNLAVSVLASQGSGEVGADVGFIYVLLYDPVLDETIAEFKTGGNGANYPFEFVNVPAGEYEIVAGTDIDNDLFICDAGEACGAWLTIDQPIRIQLQSDLTDLEFPVEYLISLPTASSSGAESTTREAPRPTSKQAASHTKEFQ